MKIQSRWSLFSEGQGEVLVGACLSMISTAACWKTTPLTVLLLANDTKWFVAEVEQASLHISTYSDVATLNTRFPKSESDTSQPFSTERLLLAPEILPHLIYICTIPPEFLDLWFLRSI